MGNCNIKTWKFKELPLQNAENSSASVTPSNSNNHYNHTKQDEVFLVGYKHVSENNCPEIKLKLSDVMAGSGSGGNAECDCDLFLKYENGKLYYTLEGENNIGNADYVSIPVGGSTSISHIDFSWLNENGTASASLEGDTLILALPKFAVSGGGGGSSLPSDIDVVVDQNAQSPSGTYSNGTLTLHLVPGQNGINGHNGQDGATFELYKAVLDFTGKTGTSFYTELHTLQNGISVYKLNTTSVKWFQYNPALHTYVETTQPIVEAGVIAECCPSDVWTEGRNWDAAYRYYIPGVNLHFGLYGIYNYSSNEFEFYTAVNPSGMTVDTNEPVQLNFKLYHNISYSSGSNPEEPVDLSYKYTITGNYNDAVSLSTSVPSGLTANPYINGTCYYINKNNVGGNGNLKIYIPSHCFINTFYEMTPEGWQERVDNSLNYFEAISTTINSVTYNVYTYTVKTALGDYVTGTCQFSFEISEQTPRVAVNEGDNNQ